MSWRIRAGALPLTILFVRLLLSERAFASRKRIAVVTLVTLGPAGTCHERAALEYMAFQKVEDFQVEFISDFLEGLDQIRGRSDAFLLQCSAHPQVHQVTERYWTEVFVVDTFIYPTKALAVLRRRGVDRPRTLGLVPATAGYIDPADWEEIIDVESKPVVASGLLAGRYEAGLTHLEQLAAYPDDLQLVQEIGEIDTSWLVYGTEKRFERELIGIPSAGLFQHAERQRKVLPSAWDQVTPRRG